MSRVWRRNAVIVVGMIVAFAVIFGTVYVLSWILPTPGPVCSGPNSTQPGVTFSAASTSPAGVRIPVSGLTLNCAHDVLPASFRVDLEKNTTWADLPVSMPSANNATVNLSFADGQLYEVRWTDADASGDLSVGDSFTLTCPGGFPSADSYVFVLFWQDGATLATAPFRR